MLFVALIWSGIVAAAHSFGGLDLCTTYPEKMPPGIIEASQLPNSPAGGVELMQRYCEQCHYLPGPGRHTAAEWPALLKQMNLLMDVSNRFGNLMGKVVTPTESEREIIQHYLISNALVPLEPIPQSIKGSAYERHCDNCHALPDPQQHTAAEWPQVVQRMLQSMTVMKYSPPTGSELQEIDAYLQSATAVSNQSTANIALEPIGTEQSNESVISISSGSALALGPFVVLTLIGLWRWFYSSKRREQ